MTFTARRRLLGAHLGLLALVLIALAPLVSQLRAESRDWSWLAELACHDGIGQASAPTVQVEQTFTLDACAYCSFLINSPALGSLDWGHFDIAVVQFALPPLRPQPVLQLRFPTSQSRAPPALT